MIISIVSGSFPKPISTSSIVWVPYFVISELENHTKSVAPYQIRVSYFCILMQGMFPFFLIPETENRTKLGYTK